MATRLLARSLVSGALAILGSAAPCLAQSAYTAAPKVAAVAPAETALIERLYPVADLVTPLVEPAHVDVQNFVKLADFDKRTPEIAMAPASNDQPKNANESAATAAPPARTREDELINVLVTCVDPQSWAVKGGKSTIAYHAGCMTLAVHAVPAHHERIAAVLAELRRQQETQVALEVRMITLSGPTLERVGVEFEGPGTSTLQPVAGSTGQALEAANNLPRVSFLNGAQVAELQASIERDPQARILQLPKITMFNGQKTRVAHGDMQSFVTNVDRIQVGGQPVLVPRSEIMPTSGFFLSARPTISADRRFVKLDLQTNFTKLATPNVQLFPITTFITTVFEGGATGEPVPFTQFLQQPVLTSMLVDCSLNLPDGGTALLTGYRLMTQDKHEFGPPLLSRVPYINRLFKNVSYSNVPTQVALLVTPRIIMDSDVEMRSVLATQVMKMRGANPASGEQKPLAKLLEEYKQACAEGRLSEAQALAARALLLDPACFTKR
jgi:type II secretory pathway component GspD/PulD (secretin)